LRRRIRWSWGSVRGDPDFISYLKYGGPAAGINGLGDQRRFLKRAIGFGTSQSGRFLRTFVHDGFNANEDGKIVFDGVWAHVAGAGRGSFNFRFAQPSRDGHPHLNCLYPSDIFPFSDLSQNDAEMGNGGLLANAAAATLCRKCSIPTAVTYWGRVASLIHLARRQAGMGLGRSRVRICCRHAAWRRVVPPAQGAALNISTAMITAGSCWASGQDECLGNQRRGTAASQIPQIAKDSSSPWAH
jgi:hypothetical protein